MRIHLRHLVSLTQLVLILMSITGWELNEPSDSINSSADLSHFSGHDPFHSHSEPCQNRDHHQHVCHAGHCAFVLALNGEFDSLDDGIIARFHGILTKTLLSFDHGKSLLRPPILNS